MQSAPAAEPLPILVVDDDNALIKTLADILRLHGYAPSIAATGQEGLKLAQDQAPALAVVDLRLPDMDGMELAARLHELSQLTEVVVLTGNATVESAIAALREHSVDYLVKPVNVERLLQVASLATERWQRRHAEEKLRDSDERFRRVVESDMLGIVFWDSDGMIYDCNDAFLGMVGYSRADIAVGPRLSWSTLTPGEYDQRDQAALSDLAIDGVIPPYEKEFVRKDGRRVPVLIGAATLEGRNDRGVAFVLDITERKEAERAAEQRARQQAAIAYLGQCALVASNYPTLFERALSTVAQTLDLPMAAVFERRSDGTALVCRACIGLKDTVCGQTTITAIDKHQLGYTLLTGEPAIVDDVDAGRFELPPVFESSLPRSGVTVVIPGAQHPFGVLTAFDRTTRAFTLDDIHFLQAIAHVLGSAVDRARSDIAVRQSQRMEAVGRLASGVSHDFNNMLAAITGFAEIVHGGLSSNDPLRADVDEILKAAGRAATLTRQLLAFSKQQVLQPREVRLSDIVLDMEKMLTRLIGENVKLHNAFDADLAWVKADPGQIEQVIVNLCVNARDAMPNGGTLTIELRNVDLDLGRAQELNIGAPGQYVMLAVSDTGEGMDAETRARIFEPFFTTKAEKGTGLGLATVYGIVQQSGGDVWVYSEVGHGTTFKVFLPALAHVGISGSDPSQRLEALRGTETILLADDEEAVRRVAKRMLDIAGYKVLVAVNGTDALRVAGEYQGTIDLLVTDVMMPELTGPDVADRLRQVRPALRVLYLSGYTDLTVVRDGRIDSDAAFLQKPFASALLAQKVRDVLDA